MKQFKRIISLVIAMTMLVSMFSVGMVSASAETQSYMLGDVNFDGSVTIFDATAIQRSVAKFVGYEIEEGSIKFAAADVNGDEKVSIFDATLIQQFVAHFATVMEYGIGDTFTFGEVEDPSEDESSEVESSETPSSEDESSEVESSETPSSEDESSETPSSEEESSEEPSSEEPSSEEPSSEEPSSEEPSSEDESSEAPSSEEPSSEEESSEEPSEDVLTAGYYMVGIFNGEDCWDADKLTADRKLAENPDAAGEYILYWTFVGGDELKVAHFDGEKIDALYKVEAEPSYKIGATSDKTGYCSVKFNPAGRSDWSYTYLTVKRAEKPVDPTDKPTDAPSSETPSSDVPSSETPEELVAGYYLVGMLNGVDCWSVDALTTDRLLKANPATAGEYMLDWTFFGGDELKVAHFDGEKFDKWFNDGGENYKIGATSNKVGPGTIYFRPEGNADWSYNFFTVQPRTVDPTDKPTDAPSSEEESSEAPSSEEPSSEEESSEAPSSEEPSSEAPSSEEESSEAPSSEETKLEVGYYLVGKLNGVDCWSVDALTADRLLKANPATAGEYMLDWTFVGGDEIKVAHFDGEKFDKWFNDGGDNYIIGATSNKVGPGTIYFRPEGNADWSYNFFTVQPKTVDPTDKPTEAPSSEEPSSEEESSEAPSSEEPSSEEESSEAPSSEEPSSEEESSEAPSSEEPTEPTTEETKLEVGYYLVGKLNGVDCWSVDALTADRLLKANPATAGEYMLDWTFVGGDEIKVAHFDGEKFDKWFNDGGENYKIGATSNKVGPGTIYFRPEGNADWSYNFFTVQPKTVDPTDKPTEAPSSEEPSSEEESSETPSSEEPSSEEESSEAPSSEEPSSEEESSEAPSSEEPSSEEESSEAPSSEEPSSEEESSETPSSEDPTEPTTEETKLEVGYYLVGMLNGVDCWSVDTLTADRLLKANPAAAGEYMLDWTFVGGDEIKVAHFDGEKFDKWFNDGGDNYIIGATSNKVGPGTIYFRPEGNADWSYNFFTVQPKTVDPTEKPTEAPSSEEPSSEEESSETPSSEEPSSEEESSEAPTEKPTEAPTYVAYFVNSGKWSKVNAYAWDPTNAAWPGQAMTKTADKAPNGADVYTITFKTNYANIIFNDGSSQTTDLTFQAGQYFDYATGKWYAKLSDIPAAAVTGYTVYCVNSKNWSTVNCYVWGPNGASWPGAKMTKTGEKSSKGYDIYSFNSVQNHTNCIFNNGSSSQTADLKFTAGQYFDLATGKWYADASTI